MERHAPAKVSSVAAPKILIVEGDAGARSVHRDRLSDAGFETHAVSTASECIAVVRRLRPQVIVMEGRLPDGDGWELARLVKAMASTAQIKVIAIGEQASPMEIERALSAGCEAFLAKPVRPDVLVFQIRRLLGPKASTPPPIAPP